MAGLVVCAALRGEVFAVHRGEVFEVLQEELFVVRWEISTGRKTEFVPVLPTAAFAEVQRPLTTLTIMATATMAIIMDTVTRASSLASGSPVGAGDGVGVGVILTGTRRITMLRTVTTPTTAHHNTIVVASNRSMTVA